MQPADSVPSQLANAATAAGFQRELSTNPDEHAPHVGPEHLDVKQIVHPAMLIEAARGIQP